MAQNDNDDDYEYEETTVMVELQGIMENDFLEQVTQAKILGIDTEKPLLQLDDYTFTGKYSDTMGTCLMFEDKTETEDPKPGEMKLEYSYLTNKKLCLQRVFLKDNKDISQDTEVDGMEVENSDTTEEVKKVHPEKTDAQPGTSNANVAETSNSDVAGTSNADVVGISNAGVAGTSNAGVTGTSNADVAGTSNAGVAGTSNAGVTGTSNADVAGTSNADVAGTSNADVAGTSNADVDTDYMHLNSAKTAVKQNITAKTVDIEEVSAVQDTNK